LRSLLIAWAEGPPAIDLSWLIGRAGAAVVAKPRSVLSCPLSGR
jgi:hypothetical protein